MKQCPVCRTTYTDESLRFCLSDGNTLIDVHDGLSGSVGSASGTEETVTIPTTGRQIHVDIPAPTPRYQTAPPPASSGIVYKVIIGLLAAGLLVVVVAAAALFLFLRPGPTDNPAKNDAKTATPAPSPTKDENAELRDQIANLEKKIEEGKRTSQPNALPSVPSQPGATRPARVNSPRDGFLALRSLPSSEVGDRLIKIPHGQVISVGACGPVRGNGKWCQASYNGYYGWVFDAYLIY
jgi:hypothetical protein